jgi:hypothetical protein
MSVHPGSRLLGQAPRRVREGIRLRAPRGAGEFRYGGDGSVDLRFGVVVVRGETDEWVNAALFGVERVVFGHGGADVDAGPAECSCDVTRAAAGDLRGDDGATVRAEVVGGDARELSEGLPQPLTEGAGAVANGVKAQLEGLLHRGAEADDADVAVLPGFEAAGAVGPGEAASAIPCGGADLGNERIESLKGGVTDPQEAGSARSAEKQATGRRRSMRAQPSSLSQTRCLP